MYKQPLQSRVSHLLVVAISLLSFAPLPAAGQAPGSGPPGRARPGALRLGLESTVVAHDSFTVSSDSEFFNFAIERSNTSIGISQLAGMGPVIGYGLSDSLMLTGRVTASWLNESFGQGSGVTTTRVMVAPAIEYLFASAGAPVVPFAGAMVGVLLGKTPIAETSIDELSVLVGLQGGVHLFLGEQVSFDPGLLVAYRMGSASAGDSLGGLGTEGSISGFGILLTAGLSVWP